MNKIFGAYLIIVTVLLLALFVYSLASIRRMPDLRPSKPIAEQVL